MLRAMKRTPTALIGVALLGGACGSHTQPPQDLGNSTTRSPDGEEVDFGSASSAGAGHEDPASSGTSTSGETSESGHATTSSTMATSSEATSLGSDTTGEASESTDTGDEFGGEFPRVFPEEHTGADCALSTLPPIDALTTRIATLPDPFMLVSGERMTRRSAWRCRRAELAHMLETYALGKKPPPPTELQATYADGRLSVTVTVDGQSLTLTSTITTPDGTGPFPLVIGMDGPTGSLPGHLFTARGIATMAFPSAQLTPRTPDRGQGEVYRLYPDSAVGSMILWAWGVSRLLDGLERTADRHDLDLSRVAVTGCSYAGKMALYAGAFDERIALTLAQETGGGGEAAWRVSATRPDTEDLERAQGTAWYHQDLRRFDNTNVDLLPFDQHELAAMVAPRALLTLGNPDMIYLSSEAGYISMKAAQTVYDALGVPDRVGFSQVGGHAHCVLPQAQEADVGAFLDKFLLGIEDADTRIETSPYDTDLSAWIDWTTPALEAR